MEKDKVPIWEKYTLTIAEAADYFNIGETKLRRIISENQKAEYILRNNTKTLIKRRAFEKMLDTVSAL